MGWRKRVQEIADRDPSKLHPIIQAARGQGAHDIAWDRVSWQLEGEGEISADAAARPIFVMLDWLNAKRLLTAEGKAALRTRGKATPTRLALTRQMARPPADVFLDQYYQQWYETVAINYSIDPEMPIDDPEIDRFWSEFEASQ